MATILTFLGLYHPFSICGGSLWYGNGAGLFSFTRGDGGGNYHDGFRSVLVAE